MSQLSDFLEEHQITFERVLAESKAVERLSASDREVLNKRAAARRAKKPYEELGANDKPTGLRRGVSQKTLKLAVDGRPITRINRKKIARAVEGILRNEVEVTVLKLFGDVPSRNHKKPEASEE